MSLDEPNPSYSEMSVKQLRELLSKASEGIEAENIAKVLQKKREEELLNKAKELRPKPQRSLPSSSTNTTDNTSSDCFIATACYGDSNHPDVIVFRKWRDSNLTKTTLGQIFIFFYYAFSPQIAKHISFVPGLSSFIRYKVLEPFAFKLRQDMKL